MGTSAPPRPSSRKPTGASHSAQDSLPSFEQAWQLVAIILVAAVVAALTLKITSWIHEQSLPFCDSNSKTSENCIPCPEHGICQGGQLECLTGFRRRGRRCVEDSLIEKSAEKLARLFRDHVCYINGQSLCNRAGTVWLTEDEIIDAVKFDTKKLQGPNLWLVQEKAVSIASQLLETKIHGVRVFCCPSNIVNSYKPFGCRLREWIFGNVVKLLLMIPLLSVLISFLLKYWRYRRRAGRAEELYLQVCEALEAKATTEQLGNEKWIVAARLRDHLLKPSERKNRALWLEVERLVQEDSRIEQYPRIVRGESKTVWEWQVEGSLSPALLQSKTRSRVPPSSSPATEHLRSPSGRGSSVKRESVYSPS